MKLFLLISGGVAWGWLLIWLLIRVSKRLRRDKDSNERIYKQEYQKRREGLKKPKDDYDDYPIDYGGMTF